MNDLTTQPSSTEQYHFSMEKFISMFGAFDGSDVSQLDPFYGENIHFIDPFHELRGAEAFKRYLHQSYADISDLSMRFEKPQLSVEGEEGEAYLRHWSHRFR